ncbi:NUDIX domain-containing protein [Anaerocolumna sedimenticola]|uniref:NUDIX domain-containing protein n=1 Tax=Anaerocolumna sedimenticola TaxID=2696063 RepID=A0A6P1TSG7_9FIRM|nr:NUDIX domain-containing protein [Anaerocolumna sedimenticola]QHQ63159.1 NUDIX domain-containing protein [Anaerocolumna sedimenticola]
MGWPTHIVAAGGFVFDKKGNILIVKTHNRGWDCTGGQIEVGENLEEGVLREIMEESGVKASVRCLSGVYSNVGQNIYYDGITPVPTKVIFDFICDYEEGELTTSNETSEVIWVPKEKVLEYITSPAGLLRFKNILDFDGKVFYSSYVTQPEFKILSSRCI